MSSLTPREIVAELDKHIIGQDAAKRAVSIALRNRWHGGDVILWEKDVLLVVLPSYEEKRFVPPVVDLRDDDRGSHGKSILIKAVVVSGQRLGVIREVVRV